MAFDPSQFGAVPVKKFNPADFGAVPVTPTPIGGPTQDGFMGAVKNLGNFGLGFLKSAGRTVVDTLSGVQNSVGQPFGITGFPQTNPFAKPISNVLDKSSQALQSTNNAQRYGGYTEKVAEFAAPFFVPEVAEGALKGVKQIGKTIVGPEGMKTLEQIGSEEAQKFVPKEAGGMGKLFSHVVDRTQSAIDSFVSAGKKSLQAVKESIPKISVDPAKVLTKVNDAVMRSVENTANYKGVGGVGEGAVSMFKTPQELIDSGLLNDEEAKKAKGMISVIKNWGDYSARGILNLKESLSSFYKDGLVNSNNILSGIQSGLKDIVAEAHPPIKQALETASKQIDKADEFTRNLIGKDLVSGEAKLKQIATGLKNPALAGEKLKLLEELKQFTGHDVLPELKGYATYLELLSKEFPSKVGTILKEGGKRLGIAGGITAAGAETKRLLGF